MAFEAPQAPQGFSLLSLERLVSAWGNNDEQRLSSTGRSYTRILGLNVTMTDDQVNKLNYVAGSIPHRSMCLQPLFRYANFLLLAECKAQTKSTASPKAVFSTAVALPGSRGTITGASKTFDIVAYLWQEHGRGISIQYEGGRSNWYLSCQHNMLHFVLAMMKPEMAAKLFPDEARGLESHRLCVCGLLCRAGSKNIVYSQEHKKLHSVPGTMFACRNSCPTKSVWVADFWLLRLVTGLCRADSGIFCPSGDLRDWSLPKLLFHR